MMTFAELNFPKSLQKAIDEIGLKTLTPIQEKSHNIILSGRDVIGIAQTGTGKTLAYLLPVLKHWKFLNTNNPRVLILVPTRELAVQVNEEIVKLTPYLNIRSMAVYGGVNINTQKKNIYNGVDIVVGTPGRVLDLALDGVLKFDVIQKLIIDEFDEILSLGFKHQIVSLLSLLKNKKQNILFSATMTDDVDSMLDNFFNFPEEISLAPSGTPLENIEQFVYITPNFLTKINFLKVYLKNQIISKALVFVNNKKIVEKAFELITDDFENEVDVLHNNKSQNYRLLALQNFQDGNIKILITTDIMARGLDLKDVSHVINLQMPEIAEQYIHRIGRTGRAGNKGMAISLVSEKEEEYLLAAEVLMEKEIEVISLPKEIEISDVKLDFEKEKTIIKQPLKKIKLSSGGAFQVKKDKNKKINLGGPGKRNQKKTKPTNRAVERKRAQKRKNK